MIVGGMVDLDWLWTHMGSMHPFCTCVIFSFSRAEYFPASSTYFFFKLSSLIWEFPNSEVKLWFLLARLTFWSTSNWKWFARLLLLEYRMLYHRGLLVIFSFLTSRDVFQGIIWMSIFSFTWYYYTPCNSLNWHISLWVLWLILVLTFALLVWYVWKPIDT